MSKWGGAHVTDGTSQEQRDLPALQPNYFNLDELVFEQLLAVGAKFAAQVNFYTQQNKINGDWEALFTADEAVVMAMMLSTDLKQLESAFLRCIASNQQNAIEQILKVALTINFWFIKLASTRHASGALLREKIALLIRDKLSGALLCLFNTTSLQRSVIKQRIHDFDPAWQLLSKHENGQGELAYEEGRVRDIFYAFFNGISYLQKVTPEYLQQSLTSQRHDPAMGLFMAFITLFRSAQNTANTFTARHQHFYYSDVLGTAPRQAVPDSAYIHLTAQPGMQPVLVEQGSQFSAGKDKQHREILYGADRSHWVSDVSVGEIYTLNLRYDERISPESDLGFIRSIKLNKPESRGIENRWAWPLFGDITLAADRKNVSDASIGFGISSPLLNLKEGHRTIEAAVFFKTPSEQAVSSITTTLLNTTEAKTFKASFSRLFSLYLFAKRPADIIQDTQGLIDRARQLLDTDSVRVIEELLADYEYTFYKLMGSVFSLDITAASGWLAVQEYAISPIADYDGCGQSGFSIRFTLPPDIEAITPFDTGIHGEMLKAVQPVLRCRLNAHSHFFPYSLFTQFELDFVDILVEVDGYRGLQLYNRHGRLDPSKPFNPFGPLPKRNDYFVFGAYELACKNLTELKLNLQWGDLPERLGGFASYYSGYPSDFANDSFHGAFSALAGGNWQEFGKTQGLFKSRPTDSVMLSSQTLDVDVLQHAHPISGAVHEDNYKYQLETQRGFFRLVLTDPESAFGHNEYPALLTGVITRNSRQKKQPEAIPNSPYTPVLTSISVDYRAKARVDLGGVNEPSGLETVQDSLFHLHPFGSERMGTVKQIPYPSLLPLYTFSNNLFIGLRCKSLATPVTLFFHLAEDHTDAQSWHQQVVWFYLSGDRWVALPAKNVLVDETNSFLSSGLITLKIPPDIAVSEQLMPKPFLWLRASAKAGELGIAGCYSISTNVVKVTRKFTDEQSTLINSYEIQPKWQTMKPIAGIGALAQVGGFLGGRRKEKPAEHKRRISERLRHKNRAIERWDYERLILEEFPDIAKVKCFNHTRKALQTAAPGHLLIAVVPKVNEKAVPANAQLRTSAVELKQIAEFIRKRCSPFISVAVTNPSYEQVLIRCEVSFKDEGGDGWVDRLNRDISAYLSPWYDSGYQAEFGWCIAQDDVVAYIRSLEYVEYVSGFSMLHITADKIHHLYDTARMKGEVQTVVNNQKVLPKLPWSIAIPARHHLIENRTDQYPVPTAPKATGVNALQIGNTFIISGSNKHDKKN